MPNLLDDLLTTSRTPSQLARTADAYRRFFQAERDDAPDVLQLVEVRFAQSFPQFALDVRSDDELAGNLAVARFDPIRIELAASGYEALARRHPEMRFALMHEFFHVVAHPGLPKSLKNGEQERKAIEDMSVEQQADDLAALFLCSARLLGEAISIRDVVLRSQIPYRVARRASTLRGIRFERLQPYDVMDLMQPEQEPL